MRILITGSSSGLGAGLASFYIDEGEQVYGISRRNNADLKELKNFNFLRQDLTKFGEVEKNIPQFLKGIESLDLVILNAGILNHVKDLKDTTLEEIQNTMNVNVWANKILIDVLFEHIQKIKQVVAISSGASKSGSRGWNAYALSKATLNMLIKLYASEFTDTHFCALAPGLIDTGMQEYVYHLPFNDKYPIIEKLKAARGTDQMPTPNEAALIISAAIKKVVNYKSGSFVDVREI